MIENIEIQDIPYVDGLPGEDQFKITWIKNDECLDGASTRYGNDGTLNRTPSQLQKNIVHLINNDFLIENKFKEVIEQINIHTNSLNDIESEGILETLNNLSTRVGELGTEQEQSKELISTNTSGISVLQNNLGDYDSIEDPEFKTVRQNIVWLKKRIGAEVGQDFNGNVDQESEGSGIKRQISDMSKSISSNKNNITDIQQKIEDANLVESKKELADLRSELGESSKAKDTSVYTRIDVLEVNDDKYNKKIDQIEESINSGVVHTAIKKVSDDLEQTNIELDSAQESIKTIDTKIEQITSDIGKNTLKIENLDSKLSATHTEITNIKNIVGELEEPTPESLIGKVNLLTDSVNDTSNSLQEIQSELGDTSTGLKGAVVVMATTLDGTNAEGSTAEELGVTKISKIAYEHTLKSVPEAPTGSAAHVLVDNEWKLLPSSVGVFYANQVSLTTTAEYQTIETPDSYIANRCSYDAKIKIQDPGIYEIKVISILGEGSVENISFQIKGETLAEGGTKHVDTFVLEDIIKIKDTVSLAIKSTDESFGEFKSPQVKIQIKPIR